MDTYRFELEQDGKGNTEVHTGGVMDQLEHWTDLRADGTPVEHFRLGTSEIQRWHEMRQGRDTVIERHVAPAEGTEEMVYLTTGHPQHYHVVDEDDPRPWVVTRCGLDSRVWAFYHVPRVVAAALGLQPCRRCYPQAEGLGPRESSSH